MTKNTLLDSLKNGSVSLTYLPLNENEPREFNVEWNAKSKAHDNFVTVWCNTELQRINDTDEMCHIVNGYRSFRYDRVVSFR